MFDLSAAKVLLTGANMMRANRQNSRVDDCRHNLRDPSYNSSGSASGLSIFFSGGGTVVNVWEVPK